MYLSLLYDLIFFLLAVVYFFVYLVKGRFHKGFCSRWGILPKDLNLDSPLWIHAVSVGEIMSMRSFIGELRKTYPHRKLVISTVTPAANKIAQGIARETDFVTYLPLDFSFIVSRVIKRINPCLVIIAETEFWPNFISCLHKNNIPVIVVNARISDRSLERYKKIKFLIRPILNKISLFCCQTDTDAQRLVSLGVLGDKVRVSGNMKFDTTEGTDKSTTEDMDKRKTIGIRDKDMLWVAASTHPGEEEIILSVYKRILADYPQVRLLIAPRHPERSRDIEKLAGRYNFPAICMSQVFRREPKRDSSSACGGVRMTERSGGVRMTERSGGVRMTVVAWENPESCLLNLESIFILDTIGELMDFYKIADIVFVGGSLVKKGGHNILEPAVLAKPVIFGPHSFNFRDITDLFLKHNAAILAHNKNELEKAVRGLLDGPDKRDELARNAKALVEKNKGATAKNLDYLKNLLSVISFQQKIFVAGS